MLTRHTSDRTLKETNMTMLTRVLASLAVGGLGALAAAGAYAEATRVPDQP